MSDEMKRIGRRMFLKAAVATATTAGLSHFRVLNHGGLGVAQAGVVCVAQVEVPDLCDPTNLGGGGIFADLCVFSGGSDPDVCLGDNIPLGDGDQCNDEKSEPDVCAPSLGEGDMPNLIVCLTPDYCGEGSPDPDVCGVAEPDVCDPTNSNEFSAAVDLCEPLGSGDVCPDPFGDGDVCNPAASEADSCYSNLANPALDGTPTAVRLSASEVQAASGSSVVLAGLAAVLGAVSLWFKQQVDTGQNKEE